MPYDLITTVLSGLLTAIAGLVAALLSRRFAEKEKGERKSIGDIAETVSAEAEKARARAIEAVAEKLPAGLSREEFREAFTQQIRIGGDLVISQATAEGRELVEDLVNSYHTQALSQARVQFWFSVAAATVGFVYIIYSANQIQSAEMLSYMKLLPGVIIDAVAALFFRQAEQTRERATELYDRLRKDRQGTRAEALVASIEDEAIRSAVKAQIALHMAGLQPKEIDLPTFASSANRGAKKAEQRARADAETRAAQP